MYTPGKVDNVIKSVKGYDADGLMMGGKVENDQ